MMRQAPRSTLTGNLKWLLYVPPGLTQKDSTFCIQSECIQFVWFSVPKVASSSDYEVSRGRDCVIALFLDWSGRQGAEIPQGRQGPVADHLHKF
jgi:hypothetical protein